MTVEHRTGPRPHLPQSPPQRAIKTSKCRRGGRRFSRAPAPVCDKFIRQLRRRPCNKRESPFSQSAPRSTVPGGDDPVLTMMGQVAFSAPDGSPPYRLDRLDGRTDARIGSSAIVVDARSPCRPLRSKRAPWRGEGSRGTMDTRALKSFIDGRGATVHSDHLVAARAALHSRMTNYPNLRQRLNCMLAKQSLQSCHRPNSSCSLITSVMPSREQQEQGHPME